MANKKKYKKVEAFLIKNASGISSKELADLVNKEYGTNFNTADMQGFKKRRKIKSGVRGGYSDVFPKEITEYIKTHYVGVGYRQQVENLRREFGKEYTVGQIGSFYKNHNLKCGLTGYFIPGHVPANKGEKGKCHPNARQTQFKKGSKPHNTLPVGSEVVRTDGYHKTKIAEPNVWKLTHLLVWEKTYGKIPEGMLIEFKDGNRGNTNPDNLMMVSKKEHVEMNRNNCALRSQMPELTEIGAMVAKIRVQAREKANRETTEI